MLYDGKGKYIKAINRNCVLSCRLSTEFREPCIHPDPAEFSFDKSLTRMPADEKEMFIKFVRRMITWRPEERSTAKELLTDPWLEVDFEAG